MDEQIIYDDIFEVIRVIDGSSPIINMKDKSHGHLERKLSFNLMEMPDGTIGAFPSNYVCGFL